MSDYEISQLVKHPVRANQISKYRWCAEQSTLNVVDGIHPEFQSSRMREGITLHDWLDHRPRSNIELQFEQELDALCTKNGWWDNTSLTSADGSNVQARYFIREFKGVRLKAHPDNMRVMPKKEIVVEEFKGTTDYDRANNPFTRVMYEWQLRTYVYVMRPIIEGLGYHLAQTHFLTFYNRHTADFITRFPYETMNETDYEIQLDYVFNVWLRKIEPKPPKPFKCIQCPLVFKEKCQLRQAWLDGRLNVADADKRAWRAEDLQAKGADVFDFDEFLELDEY